MTNPDSSSRSSSSASASASTSAATLHDDAMDVDVDVDVDPADHHNLDTADTSDFSNKSSFNSSTFSANGKGKGKAKAKPFTSSPATAMTAPGSAKTTPDPNNLPWVEKYRPTNLSDLVSHQDITETITKFIDQRKLPHLLFYGPPGTGKTSTILACARRLYGPHYKSMILELNASDDRGIDVVRDQIKTFASTKKIFSSGFKLIILDEADAMTQVAQAALRRVIEKYTKNVRFCIICNYVSKIIPAVQSRCTRFRFNPLEKDQIERRLADIARLEHVDLRPQGMQALLRLSGGDMRRALNVLQSAHAAFDGVVDEDAVYATTACPLPRDVQGALDAALNDEFGVAVANLNGLRIDKGYALQDLLPDMFAVLRHIEMANESKVVLYEALADIEYKLSQGCSDKIQAGALVGAFKLAVELSAAASQAAAVAAGSGEAGEDAMVL